MGEESSHQISLQGGRKCINSSVAVALREFHVLPTHFMIASCLSSGEGCGLPLTP